MPTNVYAASRSIIARFVILVAVVALALGGCTPQQAAEEPTPTPLPTPIIPTKPTYQVTKGDVEKKFEFTARISPVVSEELFFKSAGRVNKVLVKKGDQVTKGQVLSNLEGGNNDIDLRRAQINLEMAKLNLKLAELHSVPWSADYPYEIGLKKYEVELAQLNVDEVQSQVDSTQIKAGIDGTVLSVFLTEGQGVEAYKSVIVVADVNHLEASADLLDKDLQVLTEGMDVTVAPVSSPGKAVPGTIRKLPYPYGKAVPQNTQEQEDKSTRVTLKGSLEDMGLGMGDLVRVVATLEKKTGVLWLPPQAVRNFEGRQFVVVQDGNGQRRVDVKVGITGDDRVEITDGVTEGQIVVAP